MDMLKRVSHYQFTPHFFLLLLCFSAFSSQAADLNLNELRQGWQLFKVNKYPQAAELWQAKSESLTQTRRTQEQLRLAALAQVLSAIALERDDNYQAYQAWAISQTYLLESNIRWPDFQTLLREKYEQELNFLNQASTGQVQMGISLLESESQQSSLLLLEIERELSLSSYQGPEPGLIDSVLANSGSDTSVDSPIPQRSYVARPAQLEEPVTGEVETATSRGFSNETVIIEPVSEEPLPVPTSPQVAEVNVTSVTSNVISETDDPLGNVSSESVNGISSAQVIIEVANQPASRAIGVRGLMSANLIQNSQNREIAIKAWQYFSHNVDSTTGFAYDNHEYPYSTMWGIGSYLSALASSEKLGVISRPEFEQKLGLLLSSLLRMPLYNQEVPNRQYRVDTLSLTDMNNQVSNQGAGWSAIGIGRLLIWLKIVSNWYPAYKVQIEQFVSRLDLARVLQNSELNGAFHDGIGETLFNEGRFGYEQYAAMGYKLWGFNVDNALNYDTIIFKRIYEIDVPVDSRAGAHLVSDPFLLAAMEFSLIDEDFTRYTQKIYQVQKQHSLAIKRPVAQTEISLNSTPWFAYLSIFNDDKPWQVVAFDGQEHPSYAGFSTHGLFMLDAVFSDDHSKLMLADALPLASDEFGYYSGQSYDGTVINALSSHSNGVILQSLLFNKMSEPFLNQDIKVVKQ